MKTNELTGIIIDAAMEVHNSLGPGLLENVYKNCLKAELNLRQLRALSEVMLPVSYKGICLDIGYRIDLLVENDVIVELKSVAQLASIHRAQLYTYLKLSKKSVGLVINFNTKLLKDGIVRVVCKEAQ